MQNLDEFKYGVFNDGEIVSLHLTKMAAEEEAKRQDEKYPGVVVPAPIVFRSENGVRLQKGWLTVEEA